MTTKKLISFALLLLGLTFFLTLFQLPKETLATSILGHIQQGLDPMGIYLSDESHEFSLIRGAKLELTKPKFEFPDGTLSEWDAMRIQPAILALLTGKLGGSMVLTKNDGLLEIQGGKRGDQIDVRLNADQISLMKTQLVKYFLGQDLDGVLKGNVQLDGNLNELSAFTGKIDLLMNQIHLPAQNLMGFDLPSIDVKEGMFQIDLNAGKLLLNQVQIGKTGSKDDIVLKATGDITLNRNLNSSQLNLRVVFQMSDKLAEKLKLLESIIASGKQKDGTYAFKITGNLNSPFPSPDPK